MRNMKAGLIAAICLVSTSAFGQQQQTLEQTINQRLRQTVGELTVNNIIATTQVEFLERNAATAANVAKAEIDELKRQLEEVKKNAK